MQLSFFYLFVQNRFTPSHPLLNVNELVDKGFTCFNIDFTEELQKELQQLNDVVNNENGHVEQYHTERSGRYFNFDSVSSIIYDAVITEQLVLLLVAYFGDYEPMIFHAAIVHAKSATDTQCLHRDTPVRQFPVLTLLFDITNQVATTEVIPCSHQTEYVQSENLGQLSHLLVRVTNSQNAFIFHPFMAHRGVKSSSDTFKLSITFIGKPKTEADHHWCAEHSTAFGIRDNDDGLSAFAERGSYPLLAIRNLHKLD